MDKIQIQDWADDNAHLDPIIELEIALGNKKLSGWISDKAGITQLLLKSPLHVDKILERFELPAHMKLSTSGLIDNDYAIRIITAS